MTSRMDMADARVRWDEIVRRARAGEEIVLSDQGQPVIRITAADPAANGTRVFGEFAGKIAIAPDFITPLSQDEQAEWES